ncbi:MAG: LPS export ABC transporter permease LptG [Hyphococcus sp.]|nr:MAG: LPS export ABC transporter permease LptG [Marinicaulis sp.]
MPPPTLFKYIGERALIGIGGLLVILLSLVLLTDLIENMRFISKLSEGDFNLAVTLTLLRAPSLTLALFPFVFLFGSIWAFYQLNRRSELAVMRSAGLSIWRLLGPAALIAAFTGVVIITVIDPVSSGMLAYSERIKNIKQGKDRNLMRVFDDGIWLRQQDARMQILINAKTVDRDTSALKEITVWRFGPTGSFIERIDAEEAVLSGRTMEMRDARLTPIDSLQTRQTPVYAIRTSLKPEDLRDRIAKPETISLWALPNFIILAEAAGLKTVRYHMRFHDLSSTPLKLLAMVLIAAAFSLRPLRNGGIFYLVSFSIGSGFLLYVLSEISKALGESELVPVALAAWTPALVASLAAITTLLHFEDG